MTTDSAIYFAKRGALEAQYGDGGTKTLTLRWDPRAPHAGSQREWFCASFAAFAEGAAALAGVVSRPGGVTFIQPQSASQFIKYCAPELVAAGEPAGELRAAITRW